MQERKLQDWKMRHRWCRVENAGKDNVLCLLTPAVPTPITNYFPSVTFMRYVRYNVVYSCLYSIYRLYSYSQL